MAYLFIFLMTTFTLSNMPTWWNSRGPLMPKWVIFFLKNSDIGSSHTLNLLTVLQLVKEFSCSWMLTIALNVNPISNVTCTFFILQGRQVVLCVYTARSTSHEQGTKAGTIVRPIRDPLWIASSVRGCPVIQNRLAPSQGGRRGQITQARQKVGTISSSRTTFVISFDAPF